MKKFSIFFVAILTCLLIECRFNTREYFTLKKIDLYDDAGRNEQLGRDLISYDYIKLVIDKLGITDISILKNITWRYSFHPGTNEVTFRLCLQNEARFKKKELVGLFDNFVHDKLNEYGLKQHQVDAAVNKGFYFINLMATSAYDSLWKEVSPSLGKYTNKEGFIKMLLNRDARLKTKEAPKVYCRLIFDEFDNFKGDFYLINYEYHDRAVEQVVLQKVDNNFRLIGYTFFLV